MKCPCCDQEMVLGYIQCRDGVYWTPKKQFVAALASLGRGAVPLSNGASDTGNAVYAWRCAACRKIVIDCAGEEN